ncbi:TIGR03089 family protein [Tomitella fengzijianii]|uniref:TIGR03089 family protein n=1 Tax=Tomitella fengzijianii TaxID=2597660 RepID=A0A516X143_9ACTN|nr:TIGR03089 family protein [Tomitella fengzijianii]QDQ96788.1 TIGR03089 family protein [Tomitella fengzijianii]
MTPTHRTLTEKLIDPILATNPATPRVTYYDDGTGERVELSTVTLMNWAAKTANMVRDEFAAEPGTRVRIALPAHWQTAAVLLGCWWAGCEVLVGAEGSEGGDDTGSPAEIAFVAESLMQADSSAEARNADELLVLSLDAFGRPAADLPPGATDYATTVRLHGDRFMPQRIDADAPAMNGRSIADTADEARAAAAALHITDSDRVLAVAGWDDAGSIVTGLLAPFAAGASLVQVSNPDDAAMSRRFEIEKITADLR